MSVFRLHGLEKHGDTQTLLYINYSPDDLQEKNNNDELYLNSKFSEAVYKDIT